jgi:hypothetical protein
MSSAGRSITVQLITESGTTTSLISLLDQITTSNIVSKRQFNTSDSNLPRFQELRLSLSYGIGSGATKAPSVRYVDVEYESVNSLPVS